MYAVKAGEWVRLLFALGSSNPPKLFPKEFAEWVESDFWIFMQYDSFQDYGGYFYNSWFSRFMLFEKRQLTAMVDKL